MLLIDKNGLVTHTRIHAARQLTIERGDMKNRPRDHRSSNRWVHGRILAGEL
jgi:hypothetical protein